MYHLVYKTTHIESGKFYIGVHSTTAIEDGYLGSGSHIKRAIKKHGRDAFTREVLHLCDTREEMFERERSIITPEFLLNENTYNLAEGGSGHKLDTDSRSKTVLVYDKDFNLVHTFPSYKTASKFLEVVDTYVRQACIYSTQHKSSYVGGYYVSYTDSNPIKRDETYLLERNKELWKVNVGKKRPEHGKLISEKNKQRPEAQVVYTFIHTTGMTFTGTRSALREAFPTHKILASELANLSNGRAKSTKGWSLLTP
jgi:hypothetical protein